MGVKRRGVNTYLVKNSDQDKVAKEIKDSSKNKIGRMPDIIGLCESGGLGVLSSFAQKLGDYKWQSGSKRGYPYGTEIFYSTKRFTELEGIKTRVNFCNSKGGDRGANAVALKENKSGKVRGRLVLLLDGSCPTFWGLFFSGCRFILSRGRIMSYVMEEFSLFHIKLSLGDYHGWYSYEL